VPADGAQRSRGPGAARPGDGRAPGITGGGPRGSACRAGPADPGPGGDGGPPGTGGGPGLSGGGGGWGGGDEAGNRRPRGAGRGAWSQDGPTRPVVIRHALQRDAIYAGMTAGRRRELHARAVNIVDEASGWAHRVACLDRPDEGLAAQLERLASSEAASGRLALAATHLHWASDISPARADRERRLLTRALYLMLAEEARGPAPRQ